MDIHLIDDDPMYVVLLEFHLRQLNHGKVTTFRNVDEFTRNDQPRSAAVILVGNSMCFERDYLALNQSIPGSKIIFLTENEKVASELPNSRFKIIGKCITCAEAVKKVLSSL